MSGWTIPWTGASEDRIDDATTVSGVATGLGLTGADHAEFTTHVSNKGNSLPGGNFDEVGYAQDLANGMMEEVGLEDYQRDVLSTDRAEFDPILTDRIAATDGELNPAVEPSEIQSAFDLQSQYRHQPSEVFGKLSTEGFDVEFEEQEGPPISGENANLRKLSPFTIRLIPPQDEIGLTSTAPAGGATPTQYTSAHNSYAGVGGFASSLTAAQNLEIHAATETLLVEGQMQKTGLIGPYDLADVYSQLISMVVAPPLVLLINPSSMNIQYQKLQNYQVTGRNGFLFQSWGESQPTISFSGRIGAFYAAENKMTSTAWAQYGYQPWGIFQGDYGETSTPTGLQEASRSRSASFQNFMNLLRLYRNNGYVRDRIGGSRANHAIGNVAIEYDGWFYQGHFEKMEFGFEEQNNLGGLNYSFDFTVNFMEDRRAPSYYVSPMTNALQGAAETGGGGQSISAALATGGFPPDDFGDWTDEDWEPGKTPWFSASMPTRPDGSAMSADEWWASVNAGPSWEGRSGMSGFTYDFGGWDHVKTWESDEEYQERLAEEAAAKQALEDKYADPPPPPPDPPEPAIPGIGEDARAMADQMEEALTGGGTDLDDAVLVALQELAAAMEVLAASYPQMSPVMVSMLYGEAMPEVTGAAQAMAAGHDGAYADLAAALNGVAAIIQGSSIPDIWKAAIVNALYKAAAAAAAVGDVE